MKRILYLIPILIVISFLALLGSRPKPSTSTQKITTPEPTASLPTDFTASFEIYTQGIKRVFTDAMYHQLSNEVYITGEDPGIIYVKKSGTTWADFFVTLPMELSKDCLVTGTKQTFCTNDSQTLKFFLNGQEAPDALIRKINPGDFLKVTYQ